MIGDVTRSPVQATVKALVLDEGGSRILVLREDTGLWDLPGGRLEPGESLAEGLARECREELGRSCSRIDPAPCLAWTAPDLFGFWRVMICFRAELEEGVFRLTHECVAHRFATAEELRTLELYPQTRPLPDFLDLTRLR